MALYWLSELPEQQPFASNYMSTIRDLFTVKTDGNCCIKKGTALNRFNVKLKILRHHNLIPSQHHNLIPSQHGSHISACFTLEGVSKASESLCPTLQNK